jgi:hypothetical protein
MWTRAWSEEVHQKITLALHRTKAAKRRAGINVKVGVNFHKRVFVAKPFRRLTYCSKLETVEQEAGSGTQLTVMVLVSAKIVGQFKIIKSFGLKLVSHLTVRHL